MRKTLTVRTTDEFAYIDGNTLFDDCIDILQSIAGKNKMFHLDISSKPIDGLTKADKIAAIGNTTQFKSKDGIFSVCNAFVNKLELGKQFYYKINKG